MHEPIVTATDSDGTVSIDAVTSLNPNAAVFIPGSNETSAIVEQPKSHTTVQAAQEELSKNKDELADLISRVQREIRTIHEAIMKFNEHCATQVNELDVNTLVSRSEALVAKSMALEDFHLSSSDVQGLCESVIGERDALVVDFQSTLSRASKTLEAMESSSSGGVANNHKT